MQTITQQNVTDLLAALSAFDLTNVQQMTLNSMFVDLKAAVISYQSDSPANIIALAQDVVATQATLRTATPPVTDAPAQ
jgi:hypothetical protein